MDDRNHDLITTANLENADGFYDALLTAHDGLSKKQSDDLNARLILILANHIGDGEVLKRALNAAGGKSS